MQKEIKISVIIPTWNSAKTIKQTIESCLNQTLPPIEVIVCDDGSTDNSKEIVAKINNPKVSWISGSHTGTPAIPRNKGMEVCKGDWIAFCDSDDIWLPEKLERQINEISCNLASCTNAFIKKNNIINTSTLLNWNKKYINFYNLLSTNNVVCSSALIHKSIFNKIGGFPENAKYRSFEDYIYWLRVATKTNFSFLNIPLVIYDDHPETSIRSNKIEEEQIKKQSHDDFTEWAKMENINSFLLLIKLEKIQHFIFNKIKIILKIILK